MSAEISSTSNKPPFTLETRSLDLQTDGTFTPDAAVLLTPALLQCGLLLELTPTQLQTLLLVLCGVTSNGTFVATSESLASHLHLWPGQMRARLEQLTARKWRDEPLLRSQNTESGLRLFAPSAALLGHSNVLVFPAPERKGVPLERPAALVQDGARVVGGLRNAVVEHSRATYGRPRAEVEAEINHFLASAREAVSWPRSRSARTGSEGEGQLESESGELQQLFTPEEQSRQEVANRLIAVGLSGEQARHLVRVHPLDVIERQIQYLPFRQARNPVGMLVASIEGDYAPPLAFRQASTTDVLTAGMSEDATNGEITSIQTSMISVDEVRDETPPLQGEVIDFDPLEVPSDDGNA